MSNKDPIECGICINAVYHKGTNQMAVEIQLDDISAIVTREIAEALAIDLMESAGYCEAYENGDQEAMEAIEAEAISNGGIVNTTIAELQSGNVKEYDSAEEFLADMEQPTAVDGKPVIH